VPDSELLCISGSLWQRFAASTSINQDTLKSYLHQMNRSTRYAVAADHIFDGWRKHKDAAVVFGDLYIASLIPQSELPTDLERSQASRRILAGPGFH
jgi:hypothetical protein